jgi:hypothetical protein
MPLASALELLQAHGASATAEALVPLLAVLAGLAGAWLHAAHPPANGFEPDPALVALLVV